MWITCDESRSGGAMGLIRRIANDNTINLRGGILAFFFLIAGVFPVSGQCADCRAELVVSLNKKVFVLNETLELTIQIKNTGSRAFLIPRDMLSLGPNGGIQVEVLPPKTGEMVRTSTIADCGPGCLEARDMVREVKSDWLLLEPNYSYGVVETPAVLPISPGIYKVKVTRFPPVLDEKAKRQIKEENLPVLLEQLTSPDLSVKFIPETIRR